MTHLSGDVALGSFCPEGFVGIGVPIGTDTFVQNFVTKRCMTIIDDVEKLDTIHDGFTHYQLLRFCQTTRLQYINSHILLGNRCVLQQQQVDCKIADTLLNGVTFHDITENASFSDTTSRFVSCLVVFSQERQNLWLPKDDL